MDNQLLIQLKQRISKLESDEKNLAIQVTVKNRYKILGIVMTIGGFLLASITEVTNTIWLGYVLVFLGGVVTWYLNHRALKKITIGRDNITSEIEKNKNELIGMEHS